MKGLLSGTNKFPGVVVMKKRRRGGVNIVPRKKTRKSQDQSLPVKEDGMRSTNVNGEVQSAAEIVRTELSESEDELRPRQPSKAQEITPICYDVDKATVTLQLKQMVALDGWAMVRLVAGRAAVHGYALSLGVEVLLCSNSKFAAVVAIESQVSSQAVECLPQQGGGEDDPSSSQSSEMSDIHQQPAVGARTFGCTLEFRSYREGRAEIGSVFDAIKGGEPFSKRTFRVEIAQANESLVQNDVQKRKRDEENAVDEDEMTSSGDEEEEGEELTTEGTKSVLDLADMEVDDLLDVGSPNRKKPRKDLRTPLNAVVIPESWWGAAKSILHQCEATSPLAEESGKHQNKGSLEQTRGAQIVAVIGPKNAGKSTFARFLLNFLLNSHEAVGYLDTDVGQPEFTVPGCLSLHIIREPIFGSPALHLRNPERSFFYGDVSPKGDPEMYSRSVGALFDYFQKNYGNKKSFPQSQDVKSSSSVVPLVINTHGWIKGIGYDVLVDILRHTSPTHVVQFTSQSENKNLPAGKFWESSIDSDKTTLLFIESALEGVNRPL